MSETNGVPPEGVNPALWRLKQEAEDEVKRLRAELEAVRGKLFELEEVKDKIKNYESNKFLENRERTLRELSAQRLSATQEAELRQSQSRLEAQLTQAKERLATDLETIRQAGVAAGPTKIRSARVRNELSETLDVGMRILSDYPDKLDRLVKDALALGDREDERSRMIRDRVGAEFRATAEPLKWWIHTLSAIHEEGRITEVQRMELRLRLSELESKFETANRVLKQLGVLGDTTP
ncbi:MAG: hypothetical protein K2V38_16875 [Gemmataceae bacterium]|nr:hypothetical protein [Gemmataceae bacterium]